MKARKTIAVKQIRKVDIPPAVAPRTRPKKRGLSKKDPDFYSKIGKLSVEKRAMTSEDYSAMAKLSHPRKIYAGGRKKKPSPEEGPAKVA